MGVIAMRRGLMPGFTELATDMELAAHLGTELFGVLIRLAHIAEPSVDIPGSWVVNQTQLELATFLGFSTNKCQRVLTDLAASGAIVKDAGLRLGRGMGSTNARYFIAAVPGLTVPTPRTPTPPQSPRTTRDTSNTDTRNREVNNSVLHSSVLQPSALHSVHSSPAPVWGTPDSTHLMNELNDSSSDDMKTPTSKSLTPIPAPTPTPVGAQTYSPLTTALTRIGWSAPIPTDQDPVLLAAVATWMHGQSRFANKAAYLHTVIKKGELAMFAATMGVTPPVTSPAHSSSGSPVMSSSDFVTYSATYPDWADQVTARAQILATERGCTVRMALLCEAASLIPVPTDTPASSSTDLTHLTSTTRTTHVTNEVTA
jgi:hypothetical protein